MAARSLSLKGRSQVERVRIYTIGSLYLIFWFMLVLTATGALTLVNDRVSIAVGTVLTLALGVTGTLTLRQSIRLYPERGPVPWQALGLLVVVAAVAGSLVLLLPEKAQFSGALVIVCTLCWGAGGVRDKVVQGFLFAGCPLLVLLPTGDLGYAAAAVAIVGFLTFTVQSTLWLFDVVSELERSKQTQAALAVAEERLRFSHDVHDVLGRQLSTIAVQAELAAALAERGDPRVPQYILEVRETAHEALREARELARGYRPLDLYAEVDGAVSLLKSAGITATAELTDLPPAWHEPVARVIREAVTNVLRHSAATRCVVRLRSGPSSLCLDVSDDGSGDSVWLPGVGLRSLMVRAEELGGRAVAGPTPAGGRVSAELPL